MAVIVEVNNPQVILTGPAGPPGPAGPAGSASNAITLEPIVVAGFNLDVTYETSTYLVPQFITLLDGDIVVSELHNAT